MRTACTSRFSPLLLSVLTLFLCSVALAESLFPGSVEVAGRALVLNGRGTRTATIFSLKVYEAALYLPARSHHAGEILQSLEAAQLRMRFARGVDREKLTDAFSEGVKNNTKESDSVAGPLGEFLALVPDAAEGDEFVIDFLSDRVVFHANGKMRGEVVSPEFPRALLAVWLGKAPPSKALKEGLLGNET